MTNKRQRLRFKTDVTSQSKIDVTFSLRSDVTL